MTGNISGAGFKNVKINLPLNLSAVLGPIPPDGRHIVKSKTFTIPGNASPANATIKVVVVVKDIGARQCVNHMKIVQ